MPELPFDSEELEQLILRFNAVMAREDTDIPDPGGNESDDEWPATLQETAGNLDRDEIAAHDGPVSTYLLGQPEAGDFLAEGLDKMLDYGVD